MNILLTTSAEPDKTPFFTVEKRPPLGLASLYAVLRRAGHEVFLIDNYLRPTRFIEDGFLQENRIDVVGIYANTVCLRDTLRMISLMEEMRRSGQWRGRIIAGGPAASVTPEMFPPHVDCIVQGEGERSIFAALEKNAPRVIRSERIDDLDSLPPVPWELFAGKPYDFGAPFLSRRPVFTMNTSRGCPFNCSFCSVGSIWGRKYTAFSAGRVVADIEHVMNEYGARGIYFREDNFTFNRKRAEEISRMIKERNLGIEWACESRVDSLDGDFLETMYAAGLRGLYLGVESGVQRVLDFLNKGITVEQTRRVFGWCRELGIRTAASFVVGAPTETEDELEQTVLFSKEIQPDIAWLNVFAGLPYSRLYRYAVETGFFAYMDDRGIGYGRRHNELAARFYGDKAAIAGVELPKADEPILQEQCAK